MNGKSIWKTLNGVYLFVICIAVLAIRGIASPLDKPWSLNDCRIQGLKEIKLNASQLKAICAAAPYYDIDILWKEGKATVLIGEIHEKGYVSFALGMDLIQKFSLRGLEFFPAEKRWWHYPLIGLSLFGEFLVAAYKWAIFDEDSIDRGSLMNAAYKQGYFLYFNGQQNITYLNGNKVDEVSDDLFKGQTINYHLERSEEIINTIKKECGETLVITKSCDANLLVNLRNRGMVESIVEALSRFADRNEMIVVVGASHLPGMSHLLHCEKGFSVSQVSRGLSLRLPKKLPLDQAAKSECTND